MDINRKNIMDKKDFLSDGVFDKESYEGLMISAREDGILQIGIQLEEDKVLKVDEARGEDVRQKLAEWAPQIGAIQKQWKENASSDNTSFFPVGSSIFGAIFPQQEKEKSSFVENNPRKH